MVPAVPPEIYDDTYFQQCCAGHEEWVASGGATFSGLYSGVLRRARLGEGDVVLDVGAGRGELLAVAIEMGASRAVGVEYSASAVAMAEHTLATHDITDRAEIIHGLSWEIPLEDSSVDLAMMVDIVEHLTPKELEATLREVHRVLRPGGRVLAHTLPNRLIYDVTYRWQRLLWPGRRKRWPSEPRLDLERQMHVNEQTVGSLRDMLATTGYDPIDVSLGEWIHDAHVPDDKAKALYRRLARFKLTAPYGVADIWAEGTKSA